MIKLIENMPKAPATPRPTRRWSGSWTAATAAGPTTASCTTTSSGSACGRAVVGRPPDNSPGRPPTQVAGAARSLAGLARGRARRWLGRPWPAADRAWPERAEAWFAELREPIGTP
jgi:hypothetical protein